jgi:hypothetical protein
MKIVVIDPGYEHENSHHGTVNRLVSRHCADEKIPCLIIGGKALQVPQKSANSRVIVEPYFDANIYISNREQLNAKEFRCEVNAFRKELDFLFKENIIKPSDKILMHTFFEVQFLGLLEALWINKEIFKGVVHLSFMFNPGARCNLNVSSLECLNASVYLRYKSAFNILGELQKHIQVQLSTASESYVNSYKKAFTGHNFTLHPMITNDWDVLDNSDTRSKKNVLLYLGSAKDDKGLQFTIDIAKGLRKSDDLKYILHYNSDFHGAEKYAKEIQALKLKGVVEVIDGHINQEKYKQLIFDSDYICILYDPKEYRFKTSGILWDSIKNRGCKFIVTKNTWVFDELSHVRLPFVAIDFEEVRIATQIISNIDKQNFYFTSASLNRSYLDQICGDYASWVINRMNQVSAASIQNNSDFLVNQSGKRILLIKTNYGHFTENSGPLGFLPFLRQAGYVVDVVGIDLGDEQIVPTIYKNSLSLMHLGQKYIQSYQCDSVKKEIEINEIIDSYDYVHFIDGEHCGVLTALLRTVENTKTKYIITFHQPVSYLKKLIWDQRYLEKFDLIHLMAPDQKAFFMDVNYKKFIALPHGLAPSHIQSKGMQPLTSGEERYFKQLQAMTVNKKVILTVGNWLRDYEMFIKVAKTLKDNKSYIFVVISKGLTIDLQELDNVVLYNEGVTDEFLNNAYAIADLMFLPLLDSAANNAVLESLGHALQILSTDLEAVRFYTENETLYAKHDEISFVNEIENYFSSLNQTDLMKKKNALKSVAQRLSWEEVSMKMITHIYN